ncbi:hypothetical protein Ahy_B08g090140 [Arachis hypogaea]|uniref:Histone deacetylase domain-containing protein n=1 Tax=Arachis hypogaea TaxID=3818 RepID=A0A444XZM3_ARAHY|nr:hypothetical protein Ahy_B08g090140 [Arachis hypogaea]
MLTVVKSHYLYFFPHYLTIKNLYLLYVPQFDPNGRQCLTIEGYRKIGKIVHDLAKQHSDGRLVIVQEGGYHVTYSAYCLHAFLESVLSLASLPPLPDPIVYYPEDEP